MVKSPVPLNRRSAVLLALLLPYVACSLNVCMPWSLTPTSIRLRAAIYLGLLTLPYVGVLFAIFWARWRIKIALLFTVVPLLLCLSLAGVFFEFGLLAQYQTGTDPGFEAIDRLSTIHGAVVVYRTDDGAFADYGIVVRQEKPFMPGLILTRVLYYRDHQSAASVRLRDADNVEITGVSDPPMYPVVIRSLTTFIY